MESNRRGRLSLVGLVVLASLMISVPASSGTYECHGLEATLVGTPGDDLLTGTGGDDVIVGRGGSDVIKGYKGNDVICGNSGSDQLYGGAGDDKLIGGRGHDTVRGGRGADELLGKAGNDKLWGRADSDIALGGTGSDVCVSEREGNCEMDYRGPRDVKEWRPVVAKHFPNDLVDQALFVIACESNGDPFGRNGGSGAAGLFQFIPSTWDRWNPETPGWEGETPFHPEANIATAWKLVTVSIDEGHETWWQWGAKCQPPKT